MNFDGIIFPAPPPSYSFETFSDRIFFVPRSKIMNSETNFATPSPNSKNIYHIPCYYNSWPLGASKIILYFHGNAEDLGKAESFLLLLLEQFNCHIVSIEYSSYGLYTGVHNANYIYANALNLYYYLFKFLKCID